MKKIILFVTIVSFFVYFLSTYKEVFADCQQYPCVSTGTEYCSNLSNTLLIQPKDIYGPPRDTNVDIKNFYTPNLTVNFNFTDSAENIGYCISAMPISSYVSVTDCTSIYNGKWINVNFSNSNYEVRNLTIPLNDTARGLMTEYSVAGRHNIYVYRASYGVPICTLEFQVNPITPTPLPTLTSPPKRPTFGSCSISINPGVVTDIKQAQNITLNGSIIYSDTDGWLRFPSSSSGKIFIHVKDRYGNQIVSEDINTASFQLWRPDSSLYQNTFSGNIGLNAAILTKENYYTFTIYKSEINPPSLGDAINYDIRSCSAVLKTDPDQVIPTDPPDQTDPSDPGKTKPPASICQGLPGFENNPNSERGACTDCITGKKFDGATGAYTAIGCIPTDLSTFFSQYFFVAGLGFAGGIAFLLMLWGGFTIVISQGDPQKIQQGREIIVSAGVGLLFIIFSIVILKFIGADILKIPGFE
jgi:hypothetical protein